MMGPIFNRIGHWLGRTLSRPVHVHGTSRPTPPDELLACLRPGDVLLVEGHSRISTAVKYLTQSTWSHAALFVGDALHGRAPDGHCFVEADVVEGVRSVDVGEFAGLHSRICRPRGLSEEDCRRVIRYVTERIGHQYDLRNVIDLARYLLPTPPVPQRFRRRMIALGSADPTRAICSTLIAQAFQSVRYPILPIVTQRATGDPMCPDCIEEILHIRHHSLFAPRDFDVSPYFEVVKPALAHGFDYHAQLSQHIHVAPRAAAQVQHAAALEQRRAHQATAVVARQHLGMDLRQQRLEPCRHLARIAAGGGAQVGAALQLFAVVVLHDVMHGVLPLCRRAGIVEPSRHAARTAASARPSASAPPQLEPFPAVQP